MNYKEGQSWPLPSQALPNNVLVTFNPHRSYVQFDKAWWHFGWHFLDQEVEPRKTSPSGLNLVGGTPEAPNITVFFELEYYSIDHISPSTLTNRAILDFLGPFQSC